MLKIICVNSTSWFCIFLLFQHSSSEFLKYITSDLYLLVYIKCFIILSLYPCRAEVDRVLWKVIYAWQLLCKYYTTFFWVEFITTFFCKLVEKAEVAAGLHLCHVLENLNKLATKYAELVTLTNILIASCKTFWRS